MNKPNILFIDDDDAQRREFEMNFGRLYNVVLAASRNEALEKLDRFKHPRKTPIERPENLLALTIVDQNLGDFNLSSFSNDWKDAEGLTLITYIKTQICKPTRVVVRTAYFPTQGNLGYQAAVLGADGYWPKSREDASDMEPWLRENIKREIDSFNDAVRRYNRNLQAEGAGA